MPKAEERIKIVEVGPRDGLQNEARTLSVAQRLELVERLLSSGLEHIEVGSFVDPRRVPQLADSGELLKALAGRTGHFQVLVPNLQGLDDAIAAGATEIAIFVSASEGFSERNLGCSVAESFKQYRQVARQAKGHGLLLRGYLSCVVDCPFDGPVAPKVSADLSARLVDLGCSEISLGDTIGSGTPLRIEQLLCAVIDRVPVSRLAVHFHDSYGQALANSLIALQAGIRTFDAAVAGLGGCPFAPGASGNLATEDLVYMLHGMGLPTGVELPRLLAAGDFICRQLGITTRSRAAAALAAAAD